MAVRTGVDISLSPSGSVDNLRPRADIWLKKLLVYLLWFQPLFNLTNIQMAVT